MTEPTSDAWGRTLYVDETIRCTGRKSFKDGTKTECRRILAIRAARPWAILCPRCKTLNESPGP